MKLYQDLKRTAFVIGIAIPSSVFACSDGYYSDDFGICWPYDKTVVQQLDPRTQIGKMAVLSKAILSGNGDAIKKSLGDALINSPGCLACAGIVQTVLPHLSSDQINKIVGEGFFTFLGTGSPTIVAIDTLRQIITETRMDPRENTVLNPAETPVLIKNFSSTADCITKDKKSNAILAGWKQPPVLVDGSGQSQIFPDVDLKEKDSIDLIAPLCPQLNNNEQESIEKVTINFRFSNVVPGKNSNFKYIFYGGSLMDIVLPPPPPPKN